jgi:F0F1-type ATP synthase gamma subunit
VTNLRRLELRVHAWKSFRGIARASRTFAAAQAMHWGEHQRRVSGYAQWCRQLAASYGLTPPASRRRGLVAIGTDLGLCGPVNPRVALALDAALDSEDANVWLIGERLAVETSCAAVAVLPAPTTFEAVEAVSAQLASMVDADAPLSFIVVSEVEADGRPVITTWDEPTLADVEPLPPALELTDVAAGRAEGARLLRHARIVEALTRGALSEAEARWRAMSRAHDAADHRIADQERDLRRKRQESITQEMLEVRRGRSRAT